MATDPPAPADDEAAGADDAAPEPTEVVVVLRDGVPALVEPAGAHVPTDDELAALRALPAREHQVASHAMHAFSGDDRTASLVLVLEDVLAGVGVDDLTHGTLVALPDPRALLVHVVRDEQVLRAAHLMATVARMRSSEAGAISADVYFRHVDGGLQRITEHADDEVQVRIEGRFADTLAGLGLVDRSRRARRAARRRRG
ncbi:MAG: hypothetical protein NVV70_09140 [Cellulomonas sp.]|nr:hypothetical protein [Cellulomonas sp.]MCR6648281.1 hypothetical protein [Cellulomonas sp.]